MHTVRSSAKEQQNSRCLLHNFILLILSFVLGCITDPVANLTGKTVAMPEQLLFFILHAAIQGQPVRDPSIIEQMSASNWIKVVNQSINHFLDLGGPTPTFTE